MDIPLQAHTVDPRDDYGFLIRLQDTRTLFQFDRSTDEWVIVELAENASAEIDDDEVVILRVINERDAVVTVRECGRMRLQHGDDYATLDDLNEEGLLVESLNLLYEEALPAVLETH